MSVRIVAPGIPLRGKVIIPPSKSISNRLHILQAISGGIITANGLSDSDDSNILSRHLHSPGSVMDCGDGAAVLRFLTAYFSTIPGQYTLTGSSRLRERPVAPLVNALTELGADINYLEKPDHAPLLINGGRLTGGRIVMQAGISSQFISALLMIGPILPEGLELILEGKEVSKPYSQMTLHLMAAAGIHYHLSEKKIHIPKQAYVKKDFIVESDWSAAAFWYELVALCPGSELFLVGKFNNELQGDHRIADLMEDFGVMTENVSGGICIRHVAGHSKRSVINIDFSDTPDLFPAMACTGHNWTRGAAAKSPRPGRWWWW